eukprot:c48483_g1_i1 orf=222-371(+)
MARSVMLVKKLGHSQIIISIFRLMVLSDTQFILVQEEKKCIYLGCSLDP